MGESDVLQIWDAASQTLSKEYKSIAKGSIVFDTAMLVCCKPQSTESAFNFSTASVAMTVDLAFGIFYLSSPTSNRVAFLHSELVTNPQHFQNTVNVAPGLLAVVAFCEASGFDG